ncbi:MAG TPA: hypothetical protein VFR86_18690 [Burkholderiaceae bacterium]|nr:hypothetical protein [Burkholderiaceae bacterium]
MTAEQAAKHEVGAAVEGSVWRDDLGEKRATNKMRNDGRGERMMPALIDAGNGYAGG